tara:strand:+ start:3589 stop:4185 length:597 start_codon:yes stop_codon:yes gene_type:complete
MAVANSVITFDVKDCKVYKQITDPSGDNPMTHDSAVDVPGIQEVSLEPNFITNELKGDGGAVLAKKGKIDRLNFSCTYSELSLPVLSVLTGQTLTETDTGSDGLATMGLDDASLPYFMIAFLMDDLQHASGDEPATVVCTLQKCQLTGGSLISGSTDSFSNPTFTAEAILPYGLHAAVGSGGVRRMGDIEIAETAATL